MPKRLALTVSGAVSLGSYEAGVLYELISALDAHNSATPSADEKIEIDVITGASAGGMTAAIAAQYLQHAGSSTFEPDDNPFYNPWVKMVSIEKLLELTAGDNKLNAVFSSSLVDDISKRCLTERYANATATHKRPSAASSIFLGLALSNLNGVDYGIKLRTQGGATADFVYTRHEDQLVTDVSAGDDNEAFWEPLRLAAVACGAFPFAFAVRELQRTREDYERAGQRGTSGIPTDYANNNFKFNYTDGGVFHNEPLSMAKRLVNLIDRHENVESRFYLYVSPDGKVSKMDKEFAASDATLLRTAQRIASAIFQQARFHDLKDVEEYNERIATFNRAALQVRNAIMTSADGGAALSANAQQILSGLFSDNGSVINGHLSRLQRQFNSDIGMMSQSQADNWSRVVLLLETSAKLIDKDEMKVYGITAQPHQLSSSELFAFQGFFAESLREHDYQVGRFETREFIRDLNQRALLGHPDASLGPIRYRPTDDVVIDHSLDAATMRDVDEGLRKEVRDRLADRMNDVLKDMGFSKPVRLAIRELFVEPMLKKPLDLV